jgi:hypothetical protein
MASQLVPVVVNTDHCIGHLVVRGPVGFEAYDADELSLGLRPLLMPPPRWIVAARQPEGGNAA